jgi:hypothetical protein
MIKKVVYAEGDYIEQKHECITFLKHQLHQIVSLFEQTQPQQKSGKTKKISASKTQKANPKKVKYEEYDSEEDSDGDASYQGDNKSSSDSESVYDEKRDAIPHPEITDSSASDNENSNKEDSESEGMRCIDMAKSIFCFEHVIKRFYMLKKSAKEANKGLKLENQDDKTNYEGVDADPLDNNVDHQFQRNSDVIDLQEIKRQFEWY